METFHVLSAKFPLFLCNSSKIVINTPLVRIEREEERERERERERE